MITDVSAVILLTFCLVAGIIKFMGDTTRLTEEQVLHRVKLKKSTWKAYVSYGRAPKPDGTLNKVAGPFWYQKTIDDWEASRGKRRKGSAVINRYAYQAAADYVRDGIWQVYPEIGLVVISDGVRLQITGGGNGYLAASVGWVTENGTHDTGQVMLHRVIWEHRVPGQWWPIPDGFVIDHINHITYDNRLVNLREVTQRDNILNRRFGSMDVISYTDHVIDEDTYWEDRFSRLDAE